MICMYTIEQCIRIYVYIHYVDVQSYIMIQSSNYRYQYQMVGQRRQTMLTMAYKGHRKV